jgi:putative transposase
MPASPDCHVVDRHFRLSDAFWEGFRPLLPPERPKPRGGRPRFDSHRCLEAILYLLRTGILWKALPRCMGAPSTVHDRFQEWRAVGVFGDAWRETLRTYDSEVGLAWRWQSLDGGMNKAPIGGPAIGPNPTDRGKRGVKRSILTDAEGIPLAAVIAPANRHASKLLEPTLEARVVLPPVTSQSLGRTRGTTFPSVERSLGSSSSLRTSDRSGRNLDGWNEIGSGRRVAGSWNERWGGSIDADDS